MMRLQCLGSACFFHVGDHRISLLCSIIISLALLVTLEVDAAATPLTTNNQPDNAIERWLELQGMEDEASLEDRNVDQGENEYWDNLFFHDGFNGQIEPKKEPEQVHSSFRSPRRQLTTNSDERLVAKRDLNGMSMSITHNLDILRRGLLRELSLRQREQDRRHLMENNKKFLNGIGRR